MHTRKMLIGASIGLSFAILLTFWIGLETAWGYAPSEVKRSVLSTRAVASVQIPPAPEGPHAIAAPTDLYIDEFTMTPTNPELYEPVTFTIRACNAPGGDTVAGRRVYLYIDPSDQPPLTTTQETKPFVVYVSWPPGDCQTSEYAGFTFGQSGPHVAYAWVDPHERISETNEVNNLVEIAIDVAPEIPTGPDAYESDNTCQEAQDIATNGSAQLRNFNTEDDVDWVKFQASAGDVYTITAAGTGDEAHPVFEVWDSCQVPPGSFGGTSYKLVWSPPQDGTYYLKLENDLPTYDPAQTGYRLTVQGPTAVPGTPPNVMAIGPAEGRNDQATPVIITGTNFTAQSRPALCPYNNTDTCGACTYALENARLGEGKLFATVPPYFPPGLYCLSVNNASGQAGILPQAFTVLPGRPSLAEVQPIKGYYPNPTELKVLGNNFHPGISLTLEAAGQSFSMENVQIFNIENLQATAPSSMPVGVYTLTAFYKVNEITTLPNAYTVLSTTNDLYAQAGELWIDPTAPRAQAKVEMGLFVHRRAVSGSLPLFDVPVRFFVDSAALGEKTVPPLAANDSASTWRLAWVPPQEGDYELKAVIDPDGTFPESSEENNVVTRTVTVLAPAADTIAPHVDDLRIKNSPTVTATQETVTETLVYLAVDTTDFPQPGGVGVDQLRYIEFEYNQGAQLWVPVQDSGWVINDLVNATNYRWKLSPMGGLHFIQAWAKDKEGNISRYPYQRRVNYLKPQEWVGRNQTRVYRQTLTTDQHLLVTLTPLMGDADLYIWPPDWKEGDPPWVANQSGDAVETLAITPTVAGEYQIEVYGYTAAQYELDIEVMDASMAIRQPRAPYHPSGRHWPLAPVVPVTGEPPLPPSIEIIGWPEGQINHAYPFLARVSPSSVALPITYTWQATEHPASSPRTVDAPTDTYTFTWTTPGRKAVTVTAITNDGPVEATGFITITGQQLPPVQITGPQEGTLETAYTFTATLSTTPTVGLPVTYTWTATQHPTPTLYASVLSRTTTAQFSWTTAGTQTLTVTVMNAYRSFFAIHKINIRGDGAREIYLPLIMRQG